MLGSSVIGMQFGKDLLVHPINDAKPQGVELRQVYEIDGFEPEHEVRNIRADPGQPIPE